MTKPLDDMEMRAAAFRRVFGSPEGKDVLAWLKMIAKGRISRPNLDNPNAVYYRLGQAFIVDLIEETMKYEKKEAIAPDIII